jgi:hypothetical protein
MFSTTLAASFQIAAPMAFAICAGDLDLASWFQRFLTRTMPVSQTLSELPVIDF